MSESESPPPPPSSLQGDAVPSSFDDSPDFFEERRLGKLWRRLKEEPLIPIGCLATCYALYQATKSIRQGDHHRTNRMFRARIYAQGFTLIAIVAGSLFYQDERMKRKKYQQAVEEKKAAEKRDKWIAELEARDKEDREWRENFERMSQRAKEAEAQRTGAVAKEKLDKAFRTGSMHEAVRRDGLWPGTWMWRTREAWRRI